MAFCLQCGQQIEEDIKFCSNCGMKLSYVETVQEEEKIHYAKMVITSYKKESMLKSIPCYMIFYDDQIVFAFLNKDKQNKEYKKLIKKLKREGKGFFQRSLAIIDYWNSYGNKYFKMTSDQAILESDSNYKIYHNEVEKLIFKMNYVNKMNYDENQKKSNGQIIIHANGMKHKFIHNYEKDTNIEGVLRCIYGMKLKIK